MRDRQTGQTIAWLAIYTFIVAVATAVGVLSFISPAHSDETTYRVQVELNKRGYDVGVPDGIFGPATGNAIERFQRDNGCNVTGEPSGCTMAKLFSREDRTLPAADDILSGGVAAVYTEKPQCGDFVEASAVYVGEDRATRKAWENWASLVINKEDLGIRFSDPANATDKHVECFKARPTDWWTKNCTVKARPCKQ